MLWTRIKSVSLAMSWDETRTNYYSGGETAIETVTGSYSGTTNNRIVAGQTPDAGNSDFFYFTAPMALGPMMAASPSFGFQASFLGSGSQHISRSVDGGDPELSDTTVLEYGACSFVRSGLIGDSGQPTSASVLWTISAGVNGAAFPPNSLVISWDNFDEGGVWTHSWDETEIGESNRTELTGTFIINLIT